MNLAPAICDWQSSKNYVKERGQYLLESGIWSDCRFIVGSEPNQQVFEAHKLFLAMSSPVFEAMFFGGIPENNPIAILDVQPDAFKALLEYIYTDKINLTSFDQACELCYGAKKYMLPHLLTKCMTYLWSDLQPNNACRAYEFAKLFEEPQLMARCIKIMCEQTQQVLNEPSFEDVELSTVITLFEQEELDIQSEIDLFTAISRYAARYNQVSSPRLPRMDDNLGDVNPNPGQPTIRDAIKNIRFLTLSPQEFAEGPGKSTLLSESEKFSILMNICSPSSNTAMPNGFSCNKERRRRANALQHSSSCIVGGESDSARSSLARFASLPPEGSYDQGPKKMTCSRALLRTTDCMNTSVLDCSLTFTCDKNICVYGIQIPTQIPPDEDDATSRTYADLLYAHLLDTEGSRLTYTHYTSRVQYNSLIEISFNRPIYIQKNKMYKVGVVLNKIGRYPIGTYPNQATCYGVTFTFSQGQGNDSVRDGLIRSIIFAFPPQNTNGNLGIAGMPGNHRFRPSLM